MAFFVFGGPYFVLLKKIDITLRFYFIYLFIYPHSGFSESEKENFLSNLLSSMLIVSSEEMLLVYGDRNSHVGKTTSGFGGIHEGEHGCWVKNSEDNRVLKFCTGTAADLVITNTHFATYDS